MPYKHIDSLIPAEHDGRVKLTEAQREEIRELYGTISQRKLAKRFGVSRKLIILIGKPGAMEHHKELYARRRKDGRYYDSESWPATMRKHRRKKQELFLKGKLVRKDTTMDKFDARKLLNEFSRDTRISRIYDNRDGAVSDAFLTLLPSFEYPNFSYRSVGYFLDFVNEVERMG